MENKDRVINWIRMSLSQDPHSLTESFYFDRTKQLFFSIHVVDYFMLTDDLEIDPAASVSYSDKSQQEIVAWIKRLERNDVSILKVPQKGITDDKLQEIEAIEFIEKHHIDVSSARTWEVEADVEVTIDLSDDEAPEKK